MPQPLVRAIALVLAALAVAAGAAACVDVVDSSPQAVWVQKPLIAFGTVEGTAAAECEKYGKRAVFKGVLEHRYEPAGGSAAAVTGPRTVYVPIYAFDCK
jgi:hypothetical protein